MAGRSGPAARRRPLLLPPPAQPRRVRRPACRCVPSRYGPLKMTVPPVPGTPRAEVVRVTSLCIRTGQVVAIARPEPPCTYPERRRDGELAQRLSRSGWSGALATSAQRPRRKLAPVRLEREFGYSARARRRRYVSNTQPCLSLASDRAALIASPHSQIGPEISISSGVPR